MTNEEINTAIMETLIPCQIEVTDDESYKLWRGKYSTSNPATPEKDFCNDLNVMNYALGNLEPDEKQDFFYALNDIVGLVDPFSPAWIKEFAVLDLVKANALQLAEAYLKAKGKWVD